MSSSQLSSGLRETVRVSTDHIKWSDAFNDWRLDYIEGCESAALGRFFQGYPLVAGVMQMPREDIQCFITIAKKIGIDLYTMRDIMDFVEKIAKVADVMWSYNVYGDWSQSTRQLEGLLYQAVTQ